jgi:putative transposase
LLAYCLMPNHVHFVGIPGRADSLARAFSTAHMRYSQYYNRKQSRIGHLWQGRFYSCVLGPSHLLMAARYVERNPVRSGLAEMPWDWTWSSAGTNTGGGTSSLIRLPTLLGLVDMSEDEWRQYIAERDDERDLICLRASTRTGRPAGDAEFVHGLESELNRRLRPLPLGRPKAT